MTGLQLLAVVALAGVALPLTAQQPLVHDSASVDSIRFDRAPLPGGPAAVFRFLFSEVPQWVQIGGVVLAVIVGVVLSTVAWRRRRAIAHWLASRSRGAKIALGASTVLTLGIAGGTGAWSWNYMMHENDFCSSCHVMKSAFTRFRVSEHDKLECHSCHRQSIFASAQEMYYWVLDRPEKIPAHAPVPNRICGECHEQRQSDSTWKRIIATAGHRVHFQSDSAQLKELMCVSCHAKEVHAFKARDLSCKSSGCHENTRVKLGAMAEQSGLHCVTCHDFGRPVSEEVPIDSTRTALVPARQECFSCHEMRAKLAKHGLDKDPHRATCGTCHNPHDQTQAANAFRSCATAGCHANADTLTAFHRGLGRHALDQCGSCHKPHSWKVEDTSCVSCHGDIFRRGPVPLRRSDDSPASAPFEPSYGHATPRGGPSPEDDAPFPAALQTTTATDTTFDHARHRSVTCTTCHSTSRSHGATSIRAPADCQACHHAADRRAGTCSTCHTPDELRATYPVLTTVRVARAAAPRQSSLAFEHSRHSATACESCHATDAGQAFRRTCAECHEAHHRAEATCASCHADAKASHTRVSHVTCASCHQGAGTGSLPPTRAVCLACHSAQRDHKPRGDCATCHRTTWVASERSGA